MKFFRSIFGQSGSSPTEATPSDAEPPETSATEPGEQQEPGAREEPRPREEPGAREEPELDPAARDLALQKDFNRSLSDLARRQLQYEHYRWEPDAQTDPRGTWYVVGELETLDGVLRTGTELVFEERIDAGGSPRWRLRTADGRMVELEIDRIGAPPVELSRSLERSDG
jgi:hypothetical protein